MKRFTYVLAAMMLVARAAAADAPVSKTMERAIKLYDRKDFFSASIELKKVLDGESGETTTAGSARASTW